MKSEAESKKTEYSLLLSYANREASSGIGANLENIEHHPILNGEPYRVFRSSVDLSQRRQQGTFFSSQKLSREIADLLHARLPADSLIVDPTCGMGDLLLAYAELLPIKHSLQETLAFWGKLLGGIDLRSDLVEMAKARLITLARLRGKFHDPIEGISEYFPLLKVGSMFDNFELVRQADGFLFNPPFGQTSVHNISEWGSGRINSAALYLDSLLEHRRTNAPVAAILPEVLRCGTRYSRFRSRLLSLGIRGDFSSKGRFDSWTDVDIFTTLLNESQDENLWKYEAGESAAEVTVGDIFKVSVGPVVPHRHPLKGKWHRYICAKTVPAWSQRHEPVNSRRFTGTVFTPPFVVVRRTSSPSDKNRATGSLIIGNKSVAVENHLIVLCPNDGSIETCKSLMQVLSHKDTTDFLNREIRCRHLTTTSVKSIPWIKNK